jgi:Tol biopolymer transport system component
MKRNLLIPVAILFFLLIGTILVVLYGKGYRINFKQEVPKISKTGMLVANSEPKGAQVFIDDHLTTATDSTLNLDPGLYNIRIQKEGYFSWQKKLKIEAEVVTNIDAKLLSSAPRLESIATTSIINPIIDPSHTKIAYQISSESAIKKNGIFVLNMNTNPIPVPVLTLQSSSTQITDDTTDRFSEAKLTWSPDGTEILAQISTSPEEVTSYRLQSNRLNENPQDVTAILDSVYTAWDKQKQQKEKNLFAGIKKNIRQLINKNFSNPYWSPDGKKILYTASASAELPLMIKPRRLSINTLTENRKITEGKIYVYDTKEDTNIPLPIKVTRTCPECKISLTWLPDSSHLLYINDKKIIIMDDDGSNDITVYAGPFVDNFAVPWPDNSKLVILTNLGNPNTSPTFYTIGLN